MKLVNLGCGSKFHDSWINVNFSSSGEGVLVHDLNKPFPWEDEYCDVVYHSHVLEHFTPNQSFQFLLECKRILKTNGILRIVVPDLEQIVKEYIINLNKAREGIKQGVDQYNWIMHELIDQIQRNYTGGEMIKFLKQDPLPAKDYIIKRLGSEVKNLLENIDKIESTENIRNKKRTLIKNIKLWLEDRLLTLLGYTREMAEIGKFRLSGEVHYWMYDSYSITKLLDFFGFKEICIVSATKSSIPDFSKYNLDTEEDLTIRKPDSLFIECTK